MTGKIIRKEVLNKHEQSIWDALEEHALEFRSYHGYTLEDVKQVGVRRFLKMEGWEGPKDVEKFKTDVLHLSICPNCMKDFGIAEDLFGLCRKCKPSFDLKQMMDLATVVGERAASEFLPEDQLSEEFKPIVTENAIKYTEYAFAREIRKATLARIEHKDPEVVQEETLLREAVFLKDKDLLMRTENYEKINEILENIRNEVCNHLGRTYDKNKITEA